MTPAPAEQRPSLSAASRELLARRGVGLVAALVLECLLLLLLFTLGTSKDRPEFAGEKLTTFDASPPEAPQPEEQQQPERPQPQPATEARDSPQPEAPSQPAPTLPAPPQPVPTAAAVIPTTRAEAAPPPPAPPGPPRARAVIMDQAPGVVDRGASGLPDSQRVGTAPNGQPLYAAAWYREPYDDELSGYLSTAQGPGWGLIACRTVRDWKVVDCEILGESPQGSGIAKAAAAAAWQFKVRPPRVGGQYRIGEWVRIRIDYQLRRAGNAPPRS